LQYIAEKTFKLQAKNQLLEQKLKNAQLQAQIVENGVSVGTIRKIMTIKQYFIKSGEIQGAGGEEQNAGGPSECCSTQLTN
jgi:hypothetical protein